MRTYFLHLKNERKFAAGSLTVTLSALKCFYRITCPKDWVTLEQLKVKGPKTLPEMITITQVHSIIDACTTERMAVSFWSRDASADDCVVGGREWSLVRAESLPLVA